MFSVGSFRLRSTRRAETAKSNFSILVGGPNIPIDPTERFEVIHGSDSNGESFDGGTFGWADNGERRSDSS